MVILLAALFVPAGIHLASFYDHGGVAHCIAGHKTPACAQTLAEFGSRAGILRSWSRG